jgi:hypothetical protein
MVPFPDPFFEQEKKSQSNRINDGGVKKEAKNFEKRIFEPGGHSTPCSLYG